jgi:hypothetical protein
MVQTPKSPETSQVPSAVQNTSAEEKLRPPEFGGRKGPEATRYGDWEMNGKCVDF